GDATAEVRFKEINEAYAVLKDGESRARYDRFGHAAFETGGRGGARPGGFGLDFADIFDEVFGALGGGRRGGPQSGADLRYNLEITLDDAYNGKAVTVQVPTSATCEVCAGSGAEPGSQPITCSTCGGRGRLRAQQDFFTIERTCPACQGQGKV